MYILNSKYGQNSNRIWMIARGISMALENNEDIRITSFDDLKDMYRCELPPNNSSKILVMNSWRYELDWYIVSFFSRITGIKQLNRHIGNNRWITLFCDGCDDYIEKYAKELRYFFEPKQKYIEGAMSAISELRSNYDKIVGVHVRRKDYRIWLDGRYYFDDDVYLKNMREVASLYSEDKCLFLVFSDEELDAHSFEGLDVKFPGGTAIEDQWMLSQCDHIICTVSTFATWASFIGGHVPMRTIISEHESHDGIEWK